MTTRTVETVDPVTNLPDVRRYHTKIKVLVHSHLSPYPIDVSSYVEACNVSKTLKGAGKAQVTLVASRNFMNEIYPNDYINVYFDIGAGGGWVRTFFGFVDRVSETYAVSDNGTPMSRYILACSDFQKAVEQTQIYFNPHLANRRDLVATFVGANNIGGLQLMMSGLTVTGSPADVVQSVILTLLGFGSQFILPSSYIRSAGSYARESQLARAQFLQNALPQDVLRRIQDAGGFEAAVREASSRAAETEAVRSANPQTRSNVLVSSTRSEIAESLGTSIEQTGQVLNIAGATSSNSLPTLLDIMDVFTFVEAGAIDGYLTSATIWQQQGSVMNFLMSHSHEHVNELFFDLRAADAETGVLTEGSYSTASDELGGNQGGEHTGVRYVPALVMREYPFSTVRDIDGSNVSILDGSLGVVPFGAIFSDSPGRSGRHVVTIPAISLTQRGSEAKKHLDVACLSTREIRSSDIGRSDHDHFNFTEFYSDHVIGADARFFLSDLIPITTPVHIARHGLRVRSLSTNYARYGGQTIQSNNSSLAETTEEPAEEPVDSTVPSVLPEDPIPADIPNTRVWRGVRNLANAYGVGMNVYVLARTIHSEYALSNDFPDEIDASQLAVGWAAINIALTGRRAGGGRRPFEQDAQGNDVFSTTNIARAIAPQGLFGPIGSGGDRPQATRQFPGDYDTIEETQRHAENNSFRLALSNTERALVDRYFDLAKRMLRGDSDVADPAPRGKTITFKHGAPIDPVKVANFQRNGHEIYELPPAPWSTRETYGVAYVGDDAEEEEQPEETSTPATENTTQPAAGEIDTSVTRSQIIRWALLHDHWYQHNLEYLSGSFMIRPAPEIRVGYRLDVLERAMSFYVEGVSHSWQYPEVMHTNLQVTRGQPNNPYPVYVLPPFDQFNVPDHQRQLDSRLASFFPAPNLTSVTRSLMLRDGAVMTGDFIPKATDTEDALRVFDEAVVRAGDGRDIERQPTQEQAPEPTLARVEGLDSDSTLTNKQLQDSVARSLTRIQDISDA